MLDVPLFGRRRSVEGWDVGFRISDFHPPGRGMASFEHRNVERYPHPPEDFEFRISNFHPSTYKRRGTEARRHER